MTRVRVPVLVASLALFAAACGTQPSSPETPDSPASDAASAPAPLVVGHAHVMPLRTRTSAAPAMAGANLQYYGGHVLQHVKVYAVFWGSHVDSNTTSKLPGFFTDVTDSRYFDWLQEYDTNIQTIDGNPGTNQHIGRGSFAGKVTINPSTSASQIDDSQIAAELDAQITAGHLQAPDADTIYMTYFPPNVRITQGGGASCQDFCAYHNSFSHNGMSAAYGVMPDYGPGSGCDQGCGFNAQSFDNLTSASSHELIEAVTDKDVGNDDLAWYDQTYGEIGDICENNSDGQIGTWVVQKEWSNQRGSCITDDPSVPTPTPTPPPPTPTPSGHGHSHGLAGDLPKIGGCSVAGGSGSGWLGVVGLLGLTIALRRSRA